MTVSRLNPDSTAFVFVDFQERFAGAVAGFFEAVDRACLLAQSARLMNMATVVSEQYPKGLGPTVPNLKEALGETPILEKTDFSAVRHPDFSLGGASCAVVCGVEAHVCVAQTALDLMDREVDVFIAADAVASRNPIERDLGLNRLASGGASILTVEAILFELLGGSSHPAFREVQGLIK
jgi:nicotinamidase-related amidase